MAKPDSKESKDTTPPVKADEGVENKGGGLKAWLPMILALILAPGVSFAVAQFYLLPKMETRLRSTTSEGGEVKVEADEHSAEGEHGAKHGDGNYEFSNVVVNLSGTMGTRYLKTSFVVTGAEEKPVKSVFEKDKAKLTDVTLSVLSSLTLADLEEPGSKNILREKLVAAYNQSLGGRIVEQVYFSDFVVQ